MNRSHCFLKVVLAATVIFILSWVVVVCGQDASNLVDLPPDQRTHNYGRGSCCHAGLIDLLRWHGDHEAADAWRRSYGGPQAVVGGRHGGLALKLERGGFDYAYTINGDASFLEWASRNRHGAVIHYYSGHAITFRGYAGGYAYLQNNNRPDKVIRVKKADFVRRWKGYGGKALTVIYSPYPATPKVEGEK